MVLLMVLFCLTAIASPAYADVSVDFCSNSREVFRQPPQWPAKLIRMEIEARDGMETVTRAPVELLAEVRSLNDLENAPAYVRILLARENAAPGEYSHFNDVPPAPDGRYAVLATVFANAATPAYGEYIRDCLGKEWQGSMRFRIGMPLAYERCAEDCSRIRNSALIDKLYGPPGIRTVMLDIDSLTMSTPNLTRDTLAHLGLPRNRYPFVLLSGAMLDLNDLGASRAGNLGSVFHPEIFKAEVVVRKLLVKTSHIYEPLDLVTSVRSIRPCPDGDWALLCAPQEAASRKTRISGYPETTCFGTGDCMDRRTVLADRLNARLRLGGLIGMVAALCVIGICMALSRRIKDRSSWQATMVFGIVLGLSSVGALVLLYFRTRG